MALEKKEMLFAVPRPLASPAHVHTCGRMQSALGRPIRGPGLLHSPRYFLDLLVVSSFVEWMVSSEGICDDVWFLPELLTPVVETLGGLSLCLNFASFVLPGDFLSRVILCMKVEGFHPVRLGPGNHLSSRCRNGFQKLP